MPDYVLVADRALFASRLFAAMCTVLEEKYLAIFAYHLPTGKHVNQSTCTIVTQQLQYAAENQKYWNNLVKLLKYADYTQSQKLPNMIHSAWYNLNIRWDQRRYCIQAN